MIFYYPYYNTSLPSYIYPPSFLHYYPPISYPAHHLTYNRQYPIVSTEKLTKSAQTANMLLFDAQKVLSKLSQTKYAKRLMEAAQKSNKEEVNRLIASAGVSKIPEIRYNPDGVLLSFTEKKERDNCCLISVFIKWAE